MAVSGPLKYHGGKSYLAKKIIALMPPHTRYCEPYFGGGAVLLQKPDDGVAEFVNDIDFRLTNFWNVLKDEKWFTEFQRIMEATPLSEWEFNRARIMDCDVPGPLAASMFFARNRQSRQGLGKDYCTPTSRLRGGMNENVSAWLSAVDGLPEFHRRLRRVEIRCQEALDFIRELDSPETCFYCDPPYMPRSRSSNGEFGHEMTANDHEQLLKCLASIQGKFLLSGYPDEMCDAAASAYVWRRVDFQIDNKASSAKKKQIKTESVWMNYDAG